VIADARLDLERLEAEIRRDNAQRYEWRQWLDATDRVLDWLERSNLAGRKGISRVRQRWIERELAPLPHSCLEKLSRCGRVQQVLDSIFDIQEELFRLRDPKRDLLDIQQEESFTADDLAAWECVCRRMAGDEVYSPLGGDRRLEEMERRYLVREESAGMWVLRPTWVAQLERLRKRVVA
jgi:hypothetical protein